MPADYSRIHRLLKIMTLIQSDDDWTAQRLADECGVTVRTIYRDMKILEGAEIPYFHDSKTNGYRILRDFFMPPLNLTLQESLALIALGEHIGGKEQVPLTRPAGSAIAKIRTQLPRSVRSEVQELDGHISIRLSQAGPHDGIADVYELVRTAIHKRRTLLCHYDSLAGTNSGTGTTPFLFRPYALFFSHRAWYVIGHHCGRNEMRKLKLNRFSGIQLTKQAYTIPRDFSLDDELGNAWRMIRGKKSYHIEIEFDADFGETISDTHWHSTQDIEYRENGSIVFRCTVDGLDEIVWWVLSMGPHATVKKPKSLADRVSKLASETAALYGKPAKPKSHRG